MWDHILQLYYMCISNQIHNFKIVATVFVELKIVQSVYVFKLTGWSGRINVSKGALKCAY